MESAKGQKRRKLWMRETLQIQWFGDLFCSDVFFGCPKWTPGNRGGSKMFAKPTPGQHFHHTLIWDASILRLRKSRCDGNVALALVWRTFLLHPDFRVSQTDHPNARRHQNDAKTIVIVVTFENVRFRVRVLGCRRRKTSSK